MAQWTVNAFETPNPQTMTFRFSLAEGEQVASQSSEPSGSSAEFHSSQEAERGSPLAAKLFGFPWTLSVFIGPNFLSLTKADWVDWATLEEPLRGLLTEHLQSGEPVLFSSTDSEHATSDENADSLIVSDQDSEAVRTIKQTLKDVVRPLVQQDGGDIHFHKFEDQVVYLYMRGACSGCPSSSQTLKLGIEARLKQALPEIQGVVAL